MARKNISLSRPKLFVALLTAGVILLLIPQSITNNFNFLFSNAFAPVLNIGWQKKEKIFRRGISNEETVSRQEYNELWKAYKNVYAALMQSHKDNERLAKVRLSLPKPGPAFVPVQVTNTSIRNFNHEMLVNKGSLDGLKVGQYVMCQSRNSIIGTVIETDETTASIRLLTDPHQRFEVRIWREGKQEYISGLMVGDGKTACKIPLISREHLINEGDTVYAAAKPGLLDVPIVIGEISKVAIDPSSPQLWDITVKPIEDASKLTEVAVIVSELNIDE